MDLNEAEYMAEILIHKHLPETDWTFEWDNAVRRFGCTHFRTKTITLSIKLTTMNEYDHVRDTVLHEIAHVLAGPKHGHDIVWKTQCRRIGADPTRCYDSSEVNQPPPKWRGTCPEGHVVYRNRRVRIACTKCCVKHNHGKFTIDYLFRWAENGRPVGTSEKIAANDTPREGQ